MIVLGIESSCDETGIAIYDSERGLLGDVLHSQINLHAEHGGVVPELAARDHIQRVIPLTENVLKSANLKLTDLEGIAYTSGPGLMGALLVGASFAKSLSAGLNIPALAVHHMEGHLLAPMLSPERPKFPFVALLVSGGHTMLIAVKAVGEYELIGETLDDAAGEAFDKTAKILGLGLPGGPKLAKLAENGDPNRFKFPRPMTDRPGCDFSFSGLKTYALNTVNSNEDTPQNKSDIAYAFQEAVVDTLVIKCRRALQTTNIKTLVVAGGVSANVRLRTKLSAEMAKTDSEVFYPEFKYCTDNGAMIAYVGSLRMSRGERDPDYSIQTHARWPIDSLKKLA